MEGTDEGYKVFDDGLYFKNRFRLEDGDVVIFNGREMVLHGKILGYSTNVFEIDDHKFHPFFWKELQFSNIFYLSTLILLRILRSKMTRKKTDNAPKFSYRFSKFRIGKNKYNLKFYYLLRDSNPHAYLINKEILQVSDRDYDGTFEPQTLFLFY